MAKVFPDGRSVELGPNKEPADELGFFKLHVVALQDEGFLGTLALKCRPQELRERLKAMWTTVGVVSALLCGVGLPTVISPNQKWRTEDEVTPVSKAFVYAIMIAFGLSFTVVVLFTMLIFSIDTMPTDDAIRVFVRRFQFVSDSGMVMFVASTVAMVVGCVAAVFDNYGLRAFIVILVFMGSMVVFASGIFILMHTHNAKVIVSHRLACKQALVGGGGSLPGDVKRLGEQPIAGAEAAGPGPAGTAVDATAEAPPRAPVSAGQENDGRKGSSGGGGGGGREEEGQDNKVSDADADAGETAGRFRTALGVRAGVRLR